MRSLHPWRNVPRPKVYKQERLGADNCINQRLDEFFARLINPMQVLDNNQDCFVVRPRVYQMPNETEKSMLSGSRILLRFRTHGVPQAEKIEQQRKCFVEIATVLQELDDALSSYVRRLSWLYRKRAPQQFQHRLEWRRP